VSSHPIPNQPGPIPAAPAAAPPVARRGPGRRDLWVAALVFGAAFLLYRATPIPMLLDSKYALLTSESLLRHGSWDLSPFLPELAKLGSTKLLREHGQESIYQLRVVEGRLLYVYPPGAPLLSVPLLALLRPFGSSALDAQGHYSRKLERRSQALMATLLTALAVALIYRVARYEVGSVEALFVAALAALGTTLWTVASRSLWSHTWSALLGAAAIEELLRWENGRPRRPELLGLLLVALFWARPTNAITAAAVALYVLVAHRPAVWRLVATGVAGAAAYFVYSAVVWDAALSPYVARGASFDVRISFASSLARQLFDPGIGWLVYSPIVLAIACAFAVRGVPGDRRRLAALAAAIVAGHVLYYNLRLHGIGMGAPGPRLFTDVVPWVAWLGALALRAGHPAAAPASVARPRSVAARWAIGCAVGLLAAASIAAHAEGAIQGRAGSWGGKRFREDAVAKGAREAFVDYLRVLPQVRLWPLLAGGGD
jgi:hypothetical protein